MACGLEQVRTVAGGRFPGLTCGDQSPPERTRKPTCTRIMEFHIGKGVKPETAHLPDMETEAWEAERLIAQDHKGCGWRQNRTPSPNSDSQPGALSTVPASLALGKPPTGR